MLFHVFPPRAASPWTLVILTFLLVAPGLGSGTRRLPGAASCPGICVCKPRAMYCDAAGLHWVPRHLPRDLDVLRLRDNHVRKLNHESFKGMFDLRHLTLTRNHITRIHRLTFADLYNLVTLNLSDNELSALPEQAFKQQTYVKDLSLSRNRLTDVERVLRHLENVQILNLAENRLTRISDETFDGNSAVRVLYLQSNRLTQIDRRAFKRLTLLTHLSLRDNPLAAIDVFFGANQRLEQLDATGCELRDVVKGTPPRLRDLRLAGNKIEFLEDDVLLHVLHVQLLVLDSNQLEVLPAKTLVRLTALTDLHLTRNKLIELPRHLPVGLRALYASENKIVRLANGTLGQQGKLRDLVLSHNRIQEVDSGALAGLRQLVSLDLSYNLIKRLSPAMFVGAHNLQRLDLSNNPLRYLEPGCFHGLRALHILQLSNLAGDSSTPVKASIFGDLESLLFLDLSNSSQLVSALVERPSGLRRIESVQDLNLMNSGLSVLPSSLRVYLPFLQAVKLTGNPWHCDAGLAWMTRWMLSGAVHFHEADLMLCESPPALRGRRIADLSSEELLQGRRRVPTSVVVNPSFRPNTTEEEFPVVIQFKRVRAKGASGSLTEERDGLLGDVTTRSVSGGEVGENKAEGEGSRVFRQVVDVHSTQSDKSSGPTDRSRGSGATVSPSGARRRGTDITGALPLNEHFGGKRGARGGLRGEGVGGDDESEEGDDSSGED